jgi:AbrB family looped-hinge helix DNA binding protein
MWHVQHMRDTPVVSVGPKGRVVIPSRIRRELGIEEGSELVALVEGEAVVLVPRSAIKSRLRSIFADVEVSMRDELLAERRAEARRESSDHA